MSLHCTVFNVELMCTTCADFEANPGITVILPALRLQAVLLGKAPSLSSWLVLGAEIKGAPLLGDSLLPQPISLLTIPVSPDVSSGHGKLAKVKKGACSSVT